MDFYKISWVLHSPLETELQSDTIFGHFCWALRYCYDEVHLQKFLNELNAPRFLLSSGSPQGYIPYPGILPVSLRLMEQFRELVRKKCASLANDQNPELIMMDLLKRLKKIRWLEMATFKDLQNSFSLPAVWIRVLEQLDLNNLQGSFEKQHTLVSSPLQNETRILIHNRIDRLSGTTTAGEASLFGEEATFYEKDSTFESYLQTDLVSEDEIRQCFDFIALGGFGRNKSTGKGHFSINLEKMEYPVINEPDAWLVLSNYVPAENDSTRAFYRGFTKFGKLGGNWATTQNPFKKPVFMLSPGTVVLGPESPTGKLLGNIHEDTGAVQNCYAVSFPFRLSGGDDE